jgi:hypothetical protein
MIFGPKSDGTYLAEFRAAATAASRLVRAARVRATVRAALKSICLTGWPPRSCLHDHFKATVDHAFSVKGHWVRVRL